jgi:hypothetical protein
MASIDGYEQVSIRRHPGQGVNERRRMNDTELPLPAQFSEKRLTQDSLLLGVE